MPSCARSDSSKVTWPIRSGFRASSCAASGVALRKSSWRRIVLTQILWSDSRSSACMTRSGMTSTSWCARAVGEFKAIRPNKPHGPLLFGTVRTWRLFAWRPVACAQHFQPGRARDSSKELPALRHQKRQAWHAGTEEGVLDFRTAKTTFRPRPAIKPPPASGNPRLAPCQTTDTMRNF